MKKIMKCWQLRKIVWTYSAGSPNPGGHYIQGSAGAVSLPCFLHLYQNTWANTTSFPGPFLGDSLHYYTLYYLFISKQCIENIIRFFCDSRNNQGLGKCYPASAFGSADNTYLARGVDYYGYHKKLDHRDFFKVILPVISTSSKLGTEKYFEKNLLLCTLPRPAALIITVAHNEKLPVWIHVPPISFRRSRMVTKTLNPDWAATFR